MTTLGDKTFPLREWWDERILWIHEAMESHLPKDADYLGNIGEAMRYSLLSGGKRFRPILCYGACEALGADGKMADCAATAYEMIHSFSLIHDDLPCMDDDDLRRGKASSHKVYGEAGALLAGDGLSIWAFHTICQIPDALPAELGLTLVRELAQWSGHHGMVGGQVLDIACEQLGEVSSEYLESVHRAKTGALITGAVRAGALIGGASPSQLENLTNYGRQVGLVFQLTDDILDSAEDPDEVSFVSVLGLERTKAWVSECTQAALSSLQQFGPEADALRALAIFLQDREV